MPTAMVSLKDFTVTRILYHSLNSPYCPKQIKLSAGDFEQVQKACDKKGIKSFAQTKNLESSDATVTKASMGHK